MARLWWLFCSALAVVGSACTRPASEPKHVLVFTAASAQDAVAESLTLFQASTGVRATYSSGASNALAEQILNGAQADVFLSASQQWADELAKKGLAKQSVPLLTNTLVIVVPASGALPIKSAADLAKAKHIALAGENVPAGEYATEALTNLHALDAIKQKIVRCSDVRATLAYVERGEADAGIVYATDARGSKNVTVVYAFPEGSHKRVVYPLVLVRDTPEARQVFEFLQGDAAMAQFDLRGFTKAK